MIEINEKALEDLGRRLAAAYISYLVAHKGVDRVLKEMPEEICGFLEADGESAVHSTCLDEARETGWPQDQRSDYKADSVASVLLRTN